MLILPTPAVCFRFLVAHIFQIIMSSHDTHTDFPQDQMSKGSTPHHLSTHNPYSLMLSPKHARQSLRSINTAASQKHEHLDSCSTDSNHLELGWSAGAGKPAGFATQVPWVRVRCWICRPMPTLYPSQETHGFQPPVPMLNAGSVSAIVQW